MINISADIDEHEAELLASLLRNQIVEHRLMAKVEYAAGSVTKAESSWHLRHADFIEAMAKKLFPNWEP